MSIFDIWKNSNDNTPVREMPKSLISAGSSNLKNKQNKFVPKTFKQPKNGYVPELNDNLSMDEIAENPFSSVFASYNRTESDMRTMMNDPTIFSATNILKSSICSLDYRLDATSKNSKALDLFEAQMDIIPLYDLIGYIINGSLFGRNMVQFVWNSDNTQYKLITDIRDKGFTDFGVRNDYSPVYLLDTNKQIPSEYYYLVVYKQSDYAKYGEPILVSCIDVWNSKMLAGYNWQKYTEKYGTPLMIGKLKNIPINTNDTTLQNYLENTTDILETIQQISVGAIDDEHVELLIEKVATGEKTAYEAYIDYLNKQISTALVGTDGTIISTPGKLGNQTENQTILYLILDNLRRFVESVINDIFLIIAKANGIAQSDIPLFTLRDGQDIDFELKQAQLDLIFKQLGINPTKDYYINGYSDLTNDNFELSENPEIGIGTVTNLLTKNTSEEKTNRIAQFANKVVAAADLNSSIEQVKENEQLLNDFLKKVVTDNGLNVAVTDLRNEVMDMINGYDTPEDLIKDIGNIYNNTGGRNIEDIIKSILTTTDIYGIDTSAKE